MRHTRPPMALYVCRHPRVETLVHALATFVRERAPADPFTPLPIAVGSRHIERWLRQELASDLGMCGNLAFPGARAALRGSVRELLSGAKPNPQTRFWDDTDARRPGSWTSPSFALDVLSAMRAARNEPAFKHVAPFVGEASTPVSSREYAFAQEAARTLERLVADRPQESLKWLQSQSLAPDSHRWLAHLMCTLHAHETAPSTAQLLASLQSRSPRGFKRPLAIFGISSLSPHDRHHVRVLAAHMPVHLFMLVPTREWIGDDRTRDEHRRAAAKATRADDREAALRALDSANPILAANGLVSRDLQAWLEEDSYNEDPPAAAESPAPPPTTLLETLQQFILDAAPMGDSRVLPWARFEGCSSVQVHSCHGALRQCEAVRDTLLERFAEDPSLEARHVLVMSPDVGTFGPLLQAVFARGIPGETGHGLPVNVSDLGLRVENPLAETLVRLLTLAGSRVTASALLDLFALGPVRQAFEIADEDLPEVRSLMSESGLRWGWDAADRESHGQPHSQQNTVAFALERLALGTLTDDQGALPVYGDTNASPVTPSTLRTSESIALFGRLAHALRMLQTASTFLAAPRSGAAWARALRQALAELTRINDVELPWRRAIDVALDGFLPTAEKSTPGAPELLLERAAIVTLLETAFDLPGPGGGAYGGAITVCALEPMRSVPFRIVAIVGLSEGAFPRAGQPPSWDPFASRKPGEPSRTDLDRHLFLEALMCARDGLFLFGTGFEEKRGKEAPMSAVCHELLDVLEAHMGPAYASTWRRHALQPWAKDPGAMTALGALRSRTFDPVWVASSQALSRAQGPHGHSPAGLQATGGAGSFPLVHAAEAAQVAQVAQVAQARTGDLDCQVFARFLRNAPRALLQGRLGLHLRESYETRNDREPLEGEDLPTWELRHELLAHLSTDVFHPDLRDNALEEFERAALLRGRAEGTSPPGARGDTDMKEHVENLRHALDTLHEACPAPPITMAATYTYRAVSHCVVARVPYVFRSVADASRVVFANIVQSKYPEDAELEAWCTLLVARACDEPVEAALVVTPEGIIRLSAPTPTESASILDDLLAAFESSRSGALLRVPRLSRSIAEAIIKSGDGDAGGTFACERIVRDCVDKTWESDSFGAGAKADPFTNALYGHLAPEDLIGRSAELAREAMAVWGPLLHARSAGAKAAGIAGGSPAANTKPPVKKVSAR